MSSIGVVYGQMNANWMSNYNSVKDYYEQNGHLPIDAESYKLPCGAESAFWIKNQRQRLRTRRLPDEQKKLLIEIGIK